LMQSKAAWVESQSILCAGACVVQKAQKDKNSLWLAKLKQMADEEVAAAIPQEGPPAAGQEGAAPTPTTASRNTSEENILRIRSSPRGSVDEVQVDDATASEHLSVASFRQMGSQLDREFEQVEVFIEDDQEEPSNPPSSARAALLREAEDREAREARVRLEREAIEQSNVAREEREVREKVRAFLTAHGYRHIRAKCSHTTMSKTYSLHCAVWCNDTDMASLLLRSRADPAQANGWGQTPLQYAQKRNSKNGSHLALLQLLEAGCGQ